MREKILDYLTTHYKGKGEQDLYFKTIAQAVGGNINSVVNVIKELDSEGLIKYIITPNGNDRVNHYYTIPTTNVIIPKPTPKKIADAIEQINNTPINIGAVDEDDYVVKFRNHIERLMNEVYNKTIQGLVTSYYNDRTWSEQYHFKDNKDFEKMELYDKEILFYETVKDDAVNLAKRHLKYEIDKTFDYYTPHLTKATMESIIRKAYSTNVQNEMRIINNIALSYISKQSMIAVAA